VLSSFSLTCYSACVFKDLGFWNLYYVEMFSPAIMFSFLFIFASSFDYLSKRKMKQSNQTNVEEKRQPKHKEPSLSAKITHAFVFILVSMYTFLATNAFQPLQCLRQPDGTSTLIADPSQDCYTSNWFSNLPVVILISLATVVAIPCWLMYSLFKNRDNLNSFSFLSRFGTLIEPYNEKLYWWEMFQVAKKTLFAVVVNSSQNYPESERLYYVIMFVFIMLVIENVARPYKFESVNAINTV
jgi:hypothetical protein